MFKFDTKICDIIEKGLEGNGLSFEETEALYGIEETSKEAALLRWAGMKLSMEAANGIAEVHAQIGLNSSPCPINCKFCSFAANGNSLKEKIELSRDDVIGYAEEYVEAGANLILLLTTANYKFEKLLEMVEAVRETISPEMPLLVNTGDLSLDKWKQLKAAGINGAYHAVRMGEGVDTTIPVSKRLETFQNLKDAHLSLSTCVEPIGPEHTPKMLAEATFRCIENDPVSGGAGKRVAVPGTPLAEKPAHTEVANANFVAVYRLASGLKPRLNCSANTPLTSASGANLGWSEVGSNPRDLVALTEQGGRGSSIKQMQKIFINSGWELLDGPSQGWMLP